jgi:hypothetical protein
MEGANQRYSTAHTIHTVLKSRNVSLYWKKFNGQVQRTNFLLHTVLYNEGVLFIICRFGTMHLLTYYRD